MDILLSKVTTPILGWIAELMGLVMNGVYTFLDSIGLPNIGGAIVLYTVIIYMCMLPLIIKQQKLQIMMRFIQPEISEVQKKYKGKRDQLSMAKMQEETNLIYQKYGTSPYGTCLPLVIQLPLIYALYNVIYHIPGYITKVSGVFSELATQIYSIPGGTTAIANFMTENSLRVTVNTMVTKTNVIDALSLLTTRQWKSLAEIPQFSDISNQINQVAANSQHINTFLGLNITESPIEIIRTNAAAGGTWWLVILAILVPLLAWFTQWINYKLMPQQAASSEMPNGMGAMNNFFPIFSAILCLSFQTGIGIYWIIGAVVRCVQMVAINRSMMKVDMEQVIKKNLEKASKKTKNKKKDISVSRVNEQAHINSRRVVEEKANQKQKLSDMDVVTDYSNNEKANNSASLFSKVNMVKKYDETATKKKINKAKPINLRDPSEITDPEARKKAEREERYRNAGQGKSSNKGSRQKK